VEPLEVRQSALSNVPRNVVPLKPLHSFVAQGQVGGAPSSWDSSPMVSVRFLNVGWLVNHTAGSGVNVKNWDLIGGCQFSSPGSVMLRLSNGKTI